MSNRFGWEAGPMHLYAVHARRDEEVVAAAVVIARNSRSAILRAQRLTGFDGDGAEIMTQQLQTLDRTLPTQAWLLWPEVPR